MGRPSWWVGKQWGSGFAALDWGEHSGLLPSHSWDSQETQGTGWSLRTALNTRKQKRPLYTPPSLVLQTETEPQNQWHGLSGLPVGQCMGRPEPHGKAPSPTLSWGPGSPLG